MNIVLITVVLFVFSSKFECAEQYNDYKNYKLYNIEGNIDKLLLTLNNINKNRGQAVLYLDSKFNKHQVLVEPEAAQVFKEILAQNQLNGTLVSNDISEIIRLEKGKSKSETYSFKSYHDVNEIYKFITNISNTYTTWSKLIIGGKSYEGRQILGIRINTPMPNKRYTKKPVFFIESGIHAREWIAPAATTYFINQLLTSADPNITRLRDQFDWRIFPTVNPDGYQYSYKFDRYWRKTRSVSYNGCIGADPNRNWDHNWGQHSSSNRPCDYQTYAGSKPFSEIETRTLSEYISGIDNLLFYVAFHSYASLLLIPYSDSTEHVQNYNDLVKVGKMSIEYGRKVANSEYEGPAPAAEVLSFIEENFVQWWASPGSYKASGGSMDWVYQHLKTPFVYTYELRGESFHWPPSKIPEQGDEVTQMMLGLATGAKALKYY